MLLLFVGGAKPDEQDRSRCGGTGAKMRCDGGLNGVKDYHGNLS